MNPPQSLAQAFVFFRQVRVNYLTDDFLRSAPAGIRRQKFDLYLNNQHVKEYFRCLWRSFIARCALHRAAAFSPRVVCLRPALLASQPCEKFVASCILRLADGFCGASRRLSLVG
jgi:hypothetical protein